MEDLQPVAVLEKQQGTLLSIDSIEDTTYLANELANVIKQRKLFNMVQGKEHVNVEAWQYAGARLGILAQVAGLKNLSGLDFDGKQMFKYECLVKLVDIRTDRVVGSGVGLCSTSEKNTPFLEWPKPEQ